MKSIFIFLKFLGAAIAYLILFSLFIGFVFQTFGLNAGMGAIIFACVASFILPIYFSKRDKSLNEKQNLTNFSKDVVKGTIQATKTTYELIRFIVIVIAIIIGIVVAIGAFIYLASVIGKLGSAGIIVILLALIFFQLQEINRKLH